MLKSFINAVDSAILYVVSGAILHGLGLSRWERVNSRCIIVISNIFYSVIEVELMCMVNISLNYNGVLSTRIEPDFRVFQVLQRINLFLERECLGICFQLLQFNLLGRVHAVLQPVFIGATKGSAGHDANAFEKVGVYHVHLVGLEATAAKAGNGGCDALQGRELDWLSVKHRERQSHFVKLRNIN